MRWPPRIGRYEVKRLLGSGSSAEVLLGEQALEDGTVLEVALKCVIAEQVSDRVARAILREEGRVLGLLAHPNIVALIEIIETPVLALALERLRGHTLAEAVAQRKTPLPLPTVLALGAQAAGALVAVHAAQDTEGPLELVHRDVSPENLFVTETGIVKLFDFNVAHSRGHVSAPVPGAMQGRIAYMAPEQARGEPVDGRADVFSLATVLWELVCGERLFWRGNTLATLRAVCDEPARRARDLSPAIPLALDALLAEALARDRATRPDARTFAARLRAIPL